MLNCIVVGWVKGRATQHTTLKHHEGDVGFRSSTQPTRAVSMLKLEMLNCMVVKSDPKAH